MLFLITFWIVVLTVVGILCVGLFRLVCEPEPKTEPKHDEEAKLALDSNHYEPLAHELKQIEAVVNKESKDSGNTVAEAVLVDVKTVEPGVPKEDKAINTQAIDVPDVPDQVKVSNTTATKASNDVAAADSAVVETQINEQATVNSTGSAPNVPLTTEISSKPVIVKVSAPVSAAIPIPEAIVDSNGDDVPPKLPPSPIPVIITEKPNINEIPTPYNEVESSTPIRVNLDELA